LRGNQKERKIRRPMGNWRGERTIPKCTATQTWTDKNAGKNFSVGREGRGGGNRGKVCQKK